METRTKVPICNHPDHVDGESCLNKSSVSCSKDCPCCNGVGLRFISNITGEPIYGSKAYIKLGLEQGLVASIEVVRGGYWTPISLEEWANGSFEYQSALADDYVE